MLELALPVSLALLLVAAWAAGLVALDVFTPQDVRAWRKLSSLRGYSTVRTRFERAALRSKTVSRIQRGLDLERLLAIAQRPHTPVSFLARSGGMALSAFAVLLGVDAAGNAVSGGWPVAPWLTLALAVALLPLSVFELRQAARRTQRRQAAEIADMMTMLAVMTDVRGFQLDEAVRILSRSSVDPALSTLLTEGYRRLVPRRHGNTIDQYRAIADAYGLPALRLLADAAAAANAGLSEREVYTNAAIAMYQERLVTTRQHAARARVLVTLPVAGMLIPLLVLIGAPALAAINGGL